KVARDITEKKAAERAIQETQQQLRALAASLDVQVGIRTRELEQRTVELLEQSFQVRHLSRRLLQSQDDERRRIARELHDSAGQTLTVLGLDLVRLTQEARKVAPNLADEMEHVAALAQQLNQEIRTTTYLLHPPLLDESGLAAALGWYVQGLKD